MSFQQRQTRGFSLIELLIVLVIMGVLAVVGINTLGNRQAAAVRSLMDEVEGSLNNARQLATATGRDVAVDCWGTWDPANPMVIAYGDASLNDAVLQTTANNLLISVAPPAALVYGQTVAVPFHYLPNDITQARARIVVSGSTDWVTARTATASGARNTDITALDPFQAGDPMATLGAAIAAGTPTFTGALQRSVTISGTNQRFDTTLIIEIVGIVGSAPTVGPPNGGPMGLLVVLANGSTVYKFYNPGVLEGNGQWRKI